MRAVPADLDRLASMFSDAAALCVLLSGSSAIRKPDDSVVTLADYGVQALIGRTLARSFPEDSFIAEESAEEFLGLSSRDDRRALCEAVGSVLAQRTTVGQLTRWMATRHVPSAARAWVVDPIDGTRAYVAGSRFVVGIGVLEHHRATAGALMLGDRHGRDYGLFAAREGRAARRDAGDPTWARLRVSDRKPPEARLVSDDLRGPCRIPMEPMAEGPCLSLLEAYVMIASGSADAMVSCPLEHTSRRSWDHVAGVALVEAAGGTATDASGRALEFEQPLEPMRESGLVVSNGRFHERLIRSLE